MTKRVFNKKHPLSLALGLSMALASITGAQAEVSANVSMVSDYVFRGLSQSDEEFAIQGGFDWSHESGFYLGTWASSVDFSGGTGVSGGADVEWDLYLGYGGSINESWSWDLSYVQYMYPGTVSGLNLDYGEAVVSFGYEDMVSFTLGYSNDVFNTDETGIYYEVAGGRDIGENGWSWNAAVGHYDLDDLNSSYTHYSLGVAKAFEKVSLGLTFHDSDGEQEFGYIADSRAVLSISAEF